MADTKLPPPTAIGPVERDGIQYRGIIWFLVIMTVTVLVSAGLMVGAFKFLDARARRADSPRPPMAPAAGRVPPGPNLLYMASGSPELNEPGNLEQHRLREDRILTGYTYDKATGAARIPIEKAKELLLQRGLPSRTPGQPETPAKAPEAGAAPEKPAAPAKGGADNHEGLEVHEGL